MELYNPFEDVSKAATVPPQHATVLRVLVPTGKNIGHGLDLKRVTARTKGGRRPALEVYGRKSIKGVSKGSVSAGLAQAGSYLPSRVPTATPQSGRIKGGLAARQNAKRRNLSMQQLQGSVAAPTGSTKGRRFS